MARSTSNQPGEESTTGESVRDRILNTARELFYREGVRAVGVDTVVAESGVAKTSLYRWFASKDALIAAVLEMEAADRWKGWDRNLERSSPDPRDQLRAQITGITRYLASPKFRGCPFMNVTSAFPDATHPARRVAKEAAAELHRRVHGLVSRIEGVGDPAALTDQIVMLIDGAFTTAVCMGKDGPPQHLLSATEALVDSQIRR